VISMLMPVGGAIHQLEGYIGERGDIRSKLELGLFRRNSPPRTLLLLLLLSPYHLDLVLPLLWMYQSRTPFSEAGSRSWKVEGLII
jgi:hypothetical protein